MNTIQTASSETDSDDKAKIVAAVDLGSNSFHMIVARTVNGHIQVIDRLRDMVRLAAGLDDNNVLTPEASARALACLLRFGQRLRDFPSSRVRVVGTNTLRKMRKSEQFLAAAQEALGHPIEIIAGREEARLVYLGVAHGLATTEDSRLVVDIGGGSTEVIIGKGFSTRVRESLHMGCVSMSQRFFADGEITESRMQQAVLAGRLEVRPVKHAFRKIGWQLAVGSSGTIRAIRTLVQHQGWCDSGITAGALKKLRKTLVAAGHIDNIDFETLNPQRRAVLPGGVAVLSAVFKALNIEEMSVSDEALREGLIYDMVGRYSEYDVRDHTVDQLAQRFSVDTDQARRVCLTAQHLFDHVAKCWALQAQHKLWLRWAAQLHEIGLAVSHSQYHKHGSYLVSNADMSGFSRQNQQILAVLIRGHRRKLPKSEFARLTEELRRAAQQLTALLRIAVLLHRSRSNKHDRNYSVECDTNSITLRFPENWMDEHPLSTVEMEQESQRLKSIDIKFNAL